MATVKILMLGETGSGKSTLSNYIAGEKYFEESSSHSSCTQDISCKIAKKGSRYENVLLIDTPGILDSGGKDQENMSKIIETLKKNHADGIKGILLLINVNNVRINDAVQKSLYIYCNMFPLVNFFEHLGIVFTHTYENFDEEDYDGIKKNAKSDYIPSLEKTFTNIVKEINRTKKTNIMTPDGLHYFFTDCGKTGKKYGYQRTKEEIDELVNWCSSLDVMCLDGIGAKVDVDCAHKERIDDELLESEEETIDENTTKVIKRFRAKYKVIDFHGREKEVDGDEPIRTKVFYRKKEFETPEVEETKDGDGKRTTTTTVYFRLNLYDENDKLVKKGDKQIFNTNSETKKEAQKKIEIYIKEHVFKGYKYDIEETRNGVQKYFDRISKQCVGIKILFTAANIFAFVYGLVNLVLLIFKRKKRWKIPYRLYVDQEWQKIEKTNEDGDIIIERKCLREYNEVRDYYMKPYQID